MRARELRLNVNVDHIATLRQARGGIEPDVLHGALICLEAGADGITGHLREDRRHIQDADVEALATKSPRTFNFEAACVEEMIAIALRLKPGEITLVPERREELTTEGGLDVMGGKSRLFPAVRRLRDAGLHVSLFIDPDEAQIRAASESGAHAIELHTGRYADSKGRSETLEELVKGASLAAELGLEVHAGHGLNLRNVGPVATIPEVEELNIGHSIVSRSVFVGLREAVREIRAAMDAARSSGESAA